MLGTVLTLHDVRDTEAHVRALLDVALDGMTADLDDTRYDSALSFLITEAWKLSLRNERWQGRSFSTYSRSILQKRVIDWYRDEFADTRYGRYMEAESGKRIPSAKVVEAEGEPCRTTPRCVLGFAHGDACIVKIAHRADEVSLQPQNADADDDELVGTQLYGVGDTLQTAAVDSDDLLLDLALGWQHAC